MQKGLKITHHSIWNFYEITFHSNEVYGFALFPGKVELIKNMDTRFENKRLKINVILENIYEIRSLL